MVHRGTVRLETKRLILRRFTFHRIYAHHASENPASGRVMQKCGMTYEKTSPNANVCNNGIYDDVCYSISAKEYKHD